MSHGDDQRTNRHKWITMIVDWNPVGRRKRRMPRRAWRDKVGKGIETRGLEEGK